MKSALLLSVATLVLTRADPSPVERVVLLLQDIQGRITQDGKAEQQVYDKYACWCEKATQRKASSIEEARDQLRALGQEVLAHKGTIATRSAEIEVLTDEIKENEESQKEATAIRQKENGEYMAETSEMKQALAALEKAVTVLGAATHGSSALLQAAAGRALALSNLIEAMPERAVAVVPPAKMALLREAATAVHGAGGKTAYAPQSDTITGILTDMYATFGSDLESKTQDEAVKNTNFEGFMATKQAELLTMQTMMRKKEGEKSEAEAMLSEATQSYDDTEGQMKADIEFFDTTKKACEEKSNAWSTRKALRTEELKGIQDALDILSSDEARELFGKTIKPGFQGFLQISNVGAAVPVRRAYEALKTQAVKAHSIRLATLAAEVRTLDVGHFDKVLEAIDNMVLVLKDEGKEDVAKRDQCKDEYQTIAKTIADVDWKIEKNHARIDKLENLIAKRESEKATTIEEIADIANQIKTMEEQRIEDNSNFVQAKTEDLQAIELLTQARDKLMSYGKNNSIGTFLQQGPEFEVSEDQAPEATFSDKGSRHVESKGVVSILTMIIEDLGGEIKHSVREEADEQLAFEASVAAAKKLKGELMEKKVNLEMSIAQRTSDKSEEGETLTTNTADRESQVQYEKEIKPDCDFIIGAFEERQAKRTAEMDGLAQAKEFLAGYQKKHASQADALLQGRGLRQTRAAFDDTALERIDFAGLKPASRSLRARRL